ncbi:MAG TPA: CarD family transcriptional regulator [Candidatus Saccharimonadales bacterium]|nr:CarD family transcriptional regulator [Candidatus Saccharimonadales bacterium]
MFLVDEKVVYPGYGVALISKLVRRFISGKQTSFYELKFFNKDMAVLVPEDRIEAVGIRRLSTEQDLNSMFKLLAEPIKKSSDELGINNWNRRNKKYQLSLRSGDLLKLCHIYRDLQLISHSKELSFGERNLKSKIELLLIEEIAVVKNIDKEKAAKYLQKSFLLAQKTSQEEKSSLQHVVTKTVLQSEKKTEASPKNSLKVKNISKKPKAVPKATCHTPTASLG